MQNKKSNLQAYPFFILLMILSIQMMGCTRKTQEFVENEGIKPQSEQMTEANEHKEDEESTSEDGTVPEEAELEDTKNQKDTSVSTPQTMEENRNVDVYVYICGAIKYPGVYKVTNTSRICDVIEKAGGLLESADERHLNQAQLVQDGMQCIVYTKEEIEHAKETSLESIISKNSYQEQQQNPSSKEPQTNSNKVNINHANEKELTTLNGIGESRAKAILAYRQANGDFKTIQDLMKVEGIKEGLFQKIKEQITV